MHHRNRQEATQETAEHSTMSDSPTIEGWKSEAGFGIRQSIIKVHTSQNQQHITGLTLACPVLMLVLMLEGERLP